MSQWCCHDVTSHLTNEQARTSKDIADWLVDVEPEHFPSEQHVTQSPVSSSLLFVQVSTLLVSVYGTSLVAGSPHTATTLTTELSSAI